VNPAVHVDRVSKRFRRATRGTLTRLRSVLAREQTSAPEFWAVRDVSFSVDRGEALGIIGPNGAGKSTILKLLAGILRPTVGRIAVDGRIAALIELGAGFHPELSGYENVRLNAALLGMPQRQIRSRIAEVAEFADLREFMEMPLKHYSSGMTARLGFSVAAHVEPRILLVDEVLSVGDRVFRGRCMDRMNEFLRSGTAVVFVSHDLQAVHSFCGRVLLLDQGRVARLGEPTETIANYQSRTRPSPIHTAHPDAPLVVRHARIISPDGAERSEVRPAERFSLEATMEFRRSDPNAAILVVRQSDERIVARIPFAVASTHSRLRIEMSANLLPGEYAFHIEIADPLAAIGPIATLLVLGRKCAGGVAEIRPKISVLNG
jgi:ABC-type polysaccharide/polyol phosphate transport system ATPase subunit